MTFSWRRSLSVHFKTVQLAGCIIGTVTSIKKLADSERAPTAMTAGLYWLRRHIGAIKRLILAKNMAGMIMLTCYCLADIMFIMFNLWSLSWTHFIISGISDHERDKVIVSC